MGIKQMGIKQMGTKQMGIKQMGIKQMGIKQMGIKQMGIKQMGIKQTNAWFLNYFHRFFTKNKFSKKATTFFIWRDFKGVQFQPAIENQRKSFQGLAEFPCLVKNWIKIPL